MVQIDRSNLIEARADAVVRAAVDLNSMSLVTPTYARDLALCQLLCESVERYVSSHAKHF
jgi:hypothetical protein